MAIQVVIPVDKQAVEIENRSMHTYLGDANSADAYSSYKALQDATKALNICKGMHRVLSNLGLTEEKEIVGEDIKRIEAKIQSIYEEKKEKYGFGWKGGTSC
jgi:hypothetical protein